MSILTKEALKKEFDQFKSKLLIRLTTIADMQLKDINLAGELVRESIVITRENIDKGYFELPTNTRRANLEDDIAVYVYATLIDLIVAYHAGNKPVTQEEYFRLCPSLMTRFTFILTDKKKLNIHVATDLVQESIVRGLNNRQNIKIDAHENRPNKIASYVYGTLKHVLSDHYRDKKEKRRVSLDSDSSGSFEPKSALSENPLNAAIENEIEEQILTAIHSYKSNLKSKSDKLSYILFRLEGISRKEISEALGIPENTVGTYIARVGDNLKKRYPSLAEFFKFKPKKNRYIQKRYLLPLKGQLERV